MNKLKKEKIATLSVILLVLGIVAIGIIRQSRQTIAENRVISTENRQESWEMTEEYRDPPINQQQDSQIIVDTRLSSSSITENTMNEEKSGVTFSQAFSDARETLRPGQIFIWNGKEYTTSYAEEVTKSIQLADTSILDSAEKDDDSLLESAVPTEHEETLLLSASTQN